jgi:hypothetical protein
VLVDVWRATGDACAQSDVFWCQHCHGYDGVIVVVDSSIVDPSHPKEVSNALAWVGDLFETFTTVVPPLIVLANKQVCAGLSPSSFLVVLVDVVCCVALRRFASLRRLFSRHFVSPRISRIASLRVVLRV